MRTGDLLDVTLEAFADKGKSLARIDGMVLFVAKTVPGDHARVRIFKKKKNFAEARLEALLTPSPLRTEARCRYAGTCGGCTWQHVQYEAQLEAKRSSVIGALKHAGGLVFPDVQPTLPSPDLFFYRNKMEFSFSDQRWLTREEMTLDTPPDRSFALGLHAPGAFDKVLDVEECFLQSPLSVRLVNATRDWAKRLDIAPWSVRSHTGFLRHLVIRHGVMTGETMVNLVTSGVEPDLQHAYAELLRRDFPEVTTLVNTVNSGTGQTAIGERVDVLFGPGVFHDSIGALTFEIGPQAFFQTNTRGAAQLYEVARTLAELTPTDLLYDLYCGAGTISLFCAPHVRHVVGVELVPEAIENAKANAKRNGIGNTTFLAGDLMRLFDDAFVAEHGTPDVLIVDPPRAGMHPKVVEQIARLAPSRLVYVSCNPQTQARDLALLGSGYQIDAVQPVDMFPHTAHIETVIRLTRTL